MAKNAVQTSPAGPVTNASSTKWIEPSKPNFIKLKEGQQCEGIFMGRYQSQYGPAYRFRDESGVIFSVGGNRAQIDQVFDELLGNPQGFIGDTIIGHYLIVARLSGVMSKSGRKVSVYKIGHVLDRCPKGCKP